MFISVGRDGTDGRDGIPGINGIPGTQGLPGKYAFHIPYGKESIDLFTDTAATLISPPGHPIILD